MFKVPEGFVPEKPAPGASHATDYVIQPNDQIAIEVFSNRGERLIDPNPELSNPTQKTDSEKPIYQVATNGKVKLPLINEVHLEGLTLVQAEAVVQEEYAKFFKEPYVAMGFSNKRAILLGAMGGQVIPLTNQNMRLTELLALGKGLDNNAKAQNVRVLRGDQVFVIDLSTIEGYRSGDMFIQPGDIVYVEPIRRPFSEAVRENGNIISIIVSLASLVVIILNVR